MKNLVIAVLFLAIFQATAQNEIKTIIIKGDQLITYAADNFPANEEQQVYLLVETGSTGIDMESRFYIEKGISLLMKRLQEGDQIAIGVYGAANGTILPYTALESKDIILEKIESLFKGTFAVAHEDGIDLAYNLAHSSRNEEAISTVVMLRDTGVVTASQTNTKQKNAYSISDSSTQGNLQINNEKKIIKREQAKAANHTKLGGAIALTALTILPELLDIIKD